MWIMQNVEIYITFMILTLLFLTLCYSLPCFILWNDICKQMWKNTLNRTTFKTTTDPELSDITLSALDSWEETSVNEIKRGKFFKRKMLIMI